MKTHRIELDKTRELRFSSKAVRGLDVELGERHGKGFAFFIQQISPERFKTGTADLRFDVLVSAIKHGLWHESRLTDEKVCDLIDESEAREIELWHAVADAYMDARGMRVEPLDSEQEVSNDPPEESRALASAS